MGEHENEQGFESSAEAGPSDVVIGSLMHSLVESFPDIPEMVALQKDNEAVARLKVRQLLTHAEMERVCDRLFKRVSKAIANRKSAP